MRFNRIFLFLLTFLLIALPFAGCKKADAATVEKTDVDQSNFIDELTFLGDSITAHMQLRASVHPSRVWATKNRYLNLDSRITYAKIVAPDTGEEELIADVAARLTPRYLVITLGIDYGVYYYRDKPEAFRRCYEKLLDAVHEASPDTVIILQSIFPVAKSCNVITNEMIDRANEVVRALATDRGLVFVDQKPVLADAEGYLRPEYCFGEDGIHLTASAYDAILSTLQQMESMIRGAA
jgi:lysophospholipase L1-like esterase